MSPGAKLTVWHRWGHSLSSNKTAVQLSAELDKLLKATRKDDKSIAGGYQTPSLVLADGSEVKFASDDALRAYLQRSAQPLASAEQVDALYRQVLGRGADGGGVKAAQDALAASGSPEGGSLADVRRGLAASPEAAAAVGGLYRTVLGREASAAEVASFQNTLAQGGSLQDVRSILAYSPESRSDIGALYRGVLGRAADEGGLAGFQDAVARGESLTEVRLDLAASPEATARVGDVYRQVLGREADEGSLTAARDALARGGSLSDVRASVARSEEASVRVGDLYGAVFGRGADAGGLASFQGALAQGATLDGVRVNLATSSEAQTRLTGVFKDVLGRTPESTGWMQDIVARGGSVDQIRRDLAYSVEVKQEIDVFYRRALGQAQGVDSGGLAYWQGQLAIGAMTLDQVRDAIARGTPPGMEWARQETDFKNLMALREGYRDVVYLDSVGKPTVGIGHLVLPGDNLKLGDRITDEQVEAFFQRDSTHALGAARAQAWLAGITDASFIPYLASVNYQLGTGWTSNFPTTWRLIVEGKYEEAAVEAGSSRWATQTPTRVKDFQDALRRLPPKGQ